MINVTNSDTSKKPINDYQNGLEKSSIDDTTQAKEFLKVLSNEIGTIVEQLLGSIYNVNVAEQYAESVISIYKKLLSEGLSKETAEKIVIEYSSHLDKIASYFKNQEEGS